MADNVHYTARDVARETGVSDSAVCVWLKSGTFPGVVKDGRNWRIPESMYGAVCDYARERRNNRRPLRVSGRFVQGSYDHLHRGENYRRERLGRNLRQAQQNIDARRMTCGG